LASEAAQGGGLGDETAGVDPAAAFDAHAVAAIGDRAEHLADLLQLGEITFDLGVCDANSGDYIGRVLGVADLARRRFVGTRSHGRDLVSELLRSEAQAAFEERIDGRHEVSYG